MKFILYIISASGIVSSISAGYALSVSGRVLGQRHRELDGLIDKKNLKIEPLRSAKADGWGFLFPWNILPKFFVGAWFLILVWFLVIHLRV